MFKCKLCGSTEFQLGIDPNYKGPRPDVSKNEHDEVVINTGNREFIADLMFMNQYAVCTCGEIKVWEYFFPNVKTG